MADEMHKRNQQLITGGTDNHMIVVNTRDQGVTGSKMEKICEAINITINKVVIIGDKNAATPGGIRLGTPAITTRGFDE